MLRLVVVRNMIVIQAQESRYGNFRSVCVVCRERFYLCAQPLHDLPLYINNKIYIYIYSTELSVIIKKKKKSLVIAFLEAAETKSINFNVFYKSITLTYTNVPINSYDLI